MVKVAVIGGGIFGATAAVDLARSGARVDLFESHSDLLEGATSRCQGRLHSGYHYPRSDLTAKTAREAAPEFRARYPEAVWGADQHYVIAAESRVSAEEYLSFLDRLDLPYEIVDPPQVHHAQLCVRVPEALIDTDVLRRLLRRDLAMAGVRLHFNSRTDAPVPGYDLTIAATYGQPWSKPLRYELCEVALIEVARYDSQSFVVLDGDHVSLDPHGRIHMLYDVVNSVHGVSDHPDHVWPYPGKPVSRWQKMLETASQHLRGLQAGGQGVVIYHRSLFSVRAVLPDVDATDERPTLLESHDNVISVLSGKICTAVSTAKSITEMALEIAA
jgi:hypothetical protein